ncbi:MAG: VCBS repeat-containing protein [Bacteroidetes bacterium]|nr:VCBS repeat-containing protein [Bacteroidota bacterium]
MNPFRILFGFVPVLLLVACKNKPALFDKIPSSYSGIHFNNHITENDSINPLDVVNIYNGGGVGIGDFNNDNLPDIYFAGNMVSNRLYLNKGDFKFEDVTNAAGVNGMGRWGRGVSIIDINNDGLADIYVCNTIYKDSLRRRNLLYINKGLDKNGIPHFEDMAAEYGLDARLQSTMVNFFDYDNDGDIDMYLAVNTASASYNPNRFGGSENLEPSRGKLYQNDWDSSRRHPVFHDVSIQAGITREGFSHAAIITDINCDGWKDIYVANDFLSDNVLYINNHDGTFTDHSKDYFKHTSYNSMGIDVSDINNDGLADVMELDMLPEGNYRKKMILNASNTTTYRNFELYNHQYQFVRNTLQLNQGLRTDGEDSIKTPAFSEISFMSGIAQTDWSWAPIIADFDNDSYRDIVVTNGFPKDVSDHDFIVYSDEAYLKISKAEILKHIPEIKLKNYAYKNNGDLTFSDVTDNWGLITPTFSSGAALADLDNNGTMDLVINNTNDEALIYKNTSHGNKNTAGHYLQIKFKGDQQNIAGLGAWVDIYYDKGKHQVYENTPYRGYLSTMQSIAHFGIGNSPVVDSILIRWPNGKKQTLKQVKADQTLIVNVANAQEAYSWKRPAMTESPLFKEITKGAGINYKHKDFEHIDFNIQTTLPHKLSEYCPALATGDIDGNGLDDIVMGGNSLVQAQLFLQQKDGKFLQRGLTNQKTGSTDDYKDGGLLLFDANGDGSLDLYITSAGYKHKPNSSNYQDRLYINDGKGSFALAANALPENHTSKLCVRAMDFNGDNRLDLFVSGRVDPWKYPSPVSSFIFRNDSDKEHVKFTDVTDEIAPDLKNIGMVCDALFTDFDGDNKTDLLLAGEWMPVTFLKNVNGKFKNVTPASGISDKTGWWTSIVAGDFRHTGRMDYIVGNVGLNTFYQASNQFPVYITAKDFDSNGGFESFPSLFLKDQKGVMKEFPANGRDEVIERLPAMKKLFNNYKSFATSTMDEIFPQDKREGAIRLKATMLQSCYLKNDGAGKFTMIPLPKEAQISTLNGMLADDFDGDGNLDVLINGNDFGTEVSIGRYDALNGLLLKGDGNGGFSPLSIQQSGIYIPGNGKGLVKLSGSSGNYLIAASQNKDALKLFKLERKVKMLEAGSSDVYALIKYKNGKTEKKEFYYGSAFLSQSARFANIGENVSGIVIFDNKGGKREVQF